MAGNKLPGKVRWAGRRRATTRKSGFSTTASGSEFDVVKVDGYRVAPGGSVTLKFQLPRLRSGKILGFGGWYWTSSPAQISVTDFGAQLTLTKFSPPDWNKFGSQWFSDGTQTPEISLTFAATDRSLILALYGILGG